MSFVIAISGVSGSGKSTLVQKLVERLDSAAALHFDNYASVSTYPADLNQWIAAGGDPDRWETPQFCIDLQTLRQGSAVILPDEQGRVEPAPFIVVEEPFGRERRSMADLVDFVVFIDVPLELALARKLLQYIEHLARTASEEPLASLSRYLTDYPIHRKVYQTLIQRVEPNCDLKVDGTQPVNQIVESIILLVIEKAGTSPSSTNPDRLV